MLRTAFRYVRAFQITATRQTRPFHASRSYLDQEKLRILFCGADRFSVSHLQALHSEASSPDGIISSIDVVTRTDKRRGRGSASIVSPPVKELAVQLGLNVFQLDTFTGWTPPPTDLIVAVSFGLLVPARLLGASRYGGINVHPSLLPDLRGAAPVHWAIMLGRKHTGVTIQSLHPQKFDEGVILAQTPAPGIPINGKYGGLTDTLAAFGCEMLIDVLRDGRYRPPYQPLPPREFEEIALAPKIASEHREVDFNSLTSEDILRRSLALDRIYTYAQDTSGRKVRMIFGRDMGIYTPTEAEVRAICKWQPVGHPYAIQGEDGKFLGGYPAGRSIFVNTIDGKTLHIHKMLVEGYPSMNSIMAAQKAQLLGPLRQQHGFHNYRVAWFYSPLTKAPSEEGPPS